MTIEQLIKQPTDYNFYQAVYTVQRQLSLGKEQHRKIGFDSLPQNELIRFKLVQSLGFSGRSINKLAQRTNNDKANIAVDMHVSFMGLTGCNGVLPQHYTELVLQRIKHKDTSMRDFFDIFNHRLISLFYRAWEKYRFPVNLQASTEQSTDIFTQVISKFSGPATISHYYAGIFSKKIRSADGLKQILSELTQSDVRVEQFQGKWQRLAVNERTRLGARQCPEGQYAALGIDASIGAYVWDMNAAISIYIKPKKDITNFFPGKKIAQAIQALVKLYLSKRLNYKIYLEFNQSDLPLMQLSRQAMPLGKGGCLFIRAPRSDRVCILSLS